MFKLRLAERKKQKSASSKTILVKSKTILNKPKAFLADRLYLPAEHVNERKIRREYDRRVFDQKMCNRCQVYKDGDRFSDICSTCDGYKGRFVTFELTKIKGQDYFALPAGDLKHVQKVLELNLKDFAIKDMRADVPAKNPLTFTGKLFTGKEIINGLPTANQEKIIADFMRYQTGIIQAAPRSGKTVLAIYIYSKAKKRTLYLVHEKQLLLQFYRTALDFTNLRQLRKQTGKKIVGIIQKPSDWLEDWDLVLCNYQQFITEKGFERLRDYVVRKFGQIMVDECHVASSRGFMTMLNRVDMMRRVAFSATPTRKDKMEFLMHQMLGPTNVVDQTEMAVPRVEVINTGFKPQRDYRGKAGYVFANKWLATLRKRNIMILKHIFEDLRANPKHSIVIPVLLKEQAYGLAQMINRQAAYNREHKGEKWPLIVAQHYYADKSINPTQLFDQARSGEIRVIIGIRKMMKLGLNVPRWTHMYMIFPMSNDEDFYQMTKRICTSYEGKPESVLKIFVDQMGLSLGCFRNTWNGGVLKNNYRVDGENRERASELLERKKPKEEMETSHGWN